MKKPNLIVDKSFEFSLLIIKLYKQLQAEKEFVISKQLLRAGTSIGSNINEGVSAESKKDFIHKLGISLKEARESEYWLKLLDQSDMTQIDVKLQLEEAKRLIRILSSIIITSKKNMEK